MSVVDKISTIIDNFRMSIIKQADIPFNVSLEEVDHICTKYEYYNRITEESINRFMRELYVVLRSCKTNDFVINSSANIIAKYLQNTNDFFKKELMENTKKNRFNTSVYVGVTLLDGLDYFR